MSGRIQRQVMSSELRNAARVLDFVLAHADELTPQQRTQIQQARGVLAAVSKFLFDLDPQR